jgi:hypothetical protein
MSKPRVMDVAARGGMVSCLLLAHLLTIYKGFARADLDKL